MGISSPGIGSGLDINSIVQSLVAVESQPLLLLDNKQAVLETEISAYGALQSAVNEFDQSITSLKSVNSTILNLGSSTDSTVADISVDSTADIGQYQIEVSSLAVGQRLATAGQTDSKTAIGTGTITFDFGTISGGTFDSNAGTYSGATFANNGAGQKTVTIASNTSSLEGIRDAINSELRRIN